MNEINLNLNHETVVADETAKDGEANFVIFKFDVRAVLIWLMLKWKWIVAFLLLSLVLFWGMMKYLSIYSDHAWTATAKIFHQARSDRIPSFYKPVETDTVMQFVNSRDSLTRAVSRIKGKYPAYTGEILSSVELSIDKGRKNIISVSASSRTPEMAADIANIVAEEGVQEYIKRQNDSIVNMAEERKRQRADIERQIDAIQEEKHGYNSDSTGLPPDMELNKLRDDITLLVSQKSSLEMRKQDLQIRIKNTAETLSKTDPNVVFEKIIDNTTSLGVKGKIAELERLRKRYTDNNPKIRVLVEEIADMQKESDKPEDQTPSRVTYRKSDIYSNLEIMLSQFHLELESIDASIMQYDEMIGTKRGSIERLLEKNKQYSSLLRRESMLNGKASKLSENVSDIEFLMNSAVPDVSIFESAKVPQSSNMQKLRAKAIAMSFIATAVFVAGLAAFRVGKMKVLASKEYKIALGIDDIGELPYPSQYSVEIQTAAIQQVSRSIEAANPKGKRIAFLKFGKDANIDRNIGEILNISAISGIKSFRLKCTPISDRQEDGRRNGSDDRVAQSLISVEKFADSGVFYHRNKYFLDVAESDLLKYDIDILMGQYDILTIEMECNEDSAHIGAQVARISDYTIVTSEFDDTDKMELFKNIQGIKGSNPDAKIGGILLNVRKPYFRG